MAKSSFYVYVNSQECLDEYPENRHNCFTNSLRPGLLLDEEYEVSLANIIFKPDIVSIKGRDSRYFMILTVQEVPISPYYNSNPKPISFELIYNPPFDIVAKDIREVIRIIDMDLCNFLKMDSRIENKDFDSILQFKQDDTFLKIITPKVVESKHEGYRMDFSWSFSTNFGELIGYVPPGDPVPIYRNFIEYMAPPRLPTDNDIIHVYCDIVTPSLLGKQCVHLLDLIPSRGVYTKTSVMNMYKHVAPRRIESITLRLTNRNGDDIPFAPHVDVFAALHFRQRDQ